MLSLLQVMLHTFELINFLASKNELTNFPTLFIDIGLPTLAVMFIRFYDYHDYETYEINGYDLNFDDGVRDDENVRTSCYAQQCCELKTI